MFMLCCVMSIQLSSYMVFGCIRIPIHCSNRTMNIILKIEGVGGSIVTVNYSYGKRVTLPNLPDRHFIHFSLFVQQQIYCTISGQFGMQ